MDSGLSSRQGDLSGFVATCAPDPSFRRVVQESVKEFKRALIAGDAAGALAALGRTGVVRNLVNPAQELKQLQLECARLDGNRRLSFLPSMAKLALWLGKDTEAAAYARESLALLSRAEFNLYDSAGQAAHDANTVVGIIFLKEGDTASAKRCLLAAAETTGSRELSMIGPNLTLASELLKIGERGVVAEYLSQCLAFWPVADKAVTEWVATIREGGMPDFGPNLCV